MCYIEMYTKVEALRATLEKCFRHQWAIEHPDDDDVSLVINFCGTEGDKLKFRVDYTEYHFGKSRTWHVRHELNQAQLDEIVDFVEGKLKR